MILISHRGNITGPNPKFENKPEYLIEASKAGYDVELDLWIIKGKLFLGHDKPQYKINEKMLLDESHFGDIWLHCKNIEALEFSRNKYNCFWHQSDKFVFTSDGHMWAYPSKQAYRHAINVLPEINGLTKKDLKNVKGICSDYIERYR